jgi:hypothetical protein
MGALLPVRLLTATASFIAETHLVDAKYGREIGSAHHVRNPIELKRAWRAGRG